MHRRFLDIPDGQIHYVTAGSGRPVLLLHQTPRSWDEYRDVIPHPRARSGGWSRWTRSVTGESYKPAGRCDIEDYARGAIALLDGLGIASAAVVGHHTGAVIAMELAASLRTGWSGSCSPRAPSSTRLTATGATGRAGIASTTSSRSRTARHLAELWQIRQRFYPKEPAGSADALRRRCAPGGEKIRGGSRRLQPVPDGGEDRPGALPDAGHVGDRRTRSRPAGRGSGPAHSRQPVSPDRGGSVAVVDEMPEAFARLVLDFLRVAGVTGEPPPSRWVGILVIAAGMIPIGSALVGGRRQVSRAPLARRRWSAACSFWRGCCSSRAARGAGHGLPVPDVLGASHGGAVTGGFTVLSVWALLFSGGPKAWNISGSLPLWLFPAWVAAALFYALMGVGVLLCVVMTVFASRQLARAIGAARSSLVGPRRLE